MTLLEVVVLCGSSFGYVWNDDELARMCLNQHTTRFYLQVSRTDDPQK